MQEDGVNVAFRQISETQLDQYRSASLANADAAVDVMSSILALGNVQKDTRQHLRCSMSARMLNFAIDRRFSNSKSGVLFNVIQTLLQSIQQGDSKESFEMCKFHPIGSALGMSRND